jgi:hypothetical protein
MSVKKERQDRTHRNGHEQKKQNQQEKAEMNSRHAWSTGDSPQD